MQAIARASFPGKQVYLYKDWLAGLGVPSRIIWGAEDTIVHPVATGFPPQIPVSVIPEIRTPRPPRIRPGPVNRLILA